MRPVSFNSVVLWLIICGLCGGRICFETKISQILRFLYQPKLRFEDALTRNEYEILIKFRLVFAFLYVFTSTQMCKKNNNNQNLELNFSSPERIEIVQHSKQHSGCILHSGTTFVSNENCLVVSFSVTNVKNERK
jgi:hypothetical protein